MKPITTTPIMAWTALILAAGQLFIAADVSAAGYKKADKTGASIAEFRDEIVKDLIGKTRTSGREVQQTLDVVISELNTISATLTPAKVK